MMVKILYLNSLLTLFVNDFKNNIHNKLKLDLKLNNPINGEEKLFIPFLDL